MCQYVSIVSVVLICGLWLKSPAVFLDDFCFFLWSKFVFDVQNSPDFLWVLVPEEISRCATRGIQYIWGIEEVRSRNYVKQNVSWYIEEVLDKVFCSPEIMFRSLESAELYNHAKNVGIYGWDWNNFVAEILGRILDHPDLVDNCIGDIEHLSIGSNDSHHCIMCCVIRHFYTYILVCRYD